MRIAELIRNKYIFSSDIASFFRRAGIQGTEASKVRSEQAVAELLEITQSFPGKLRQNPILDVVEQLCNPEEWFGRPKDRKAVIESVNEVIRRYGFEVLEEGEIVGTAGPIGKPSSKTISPGRAVPAVRMPRKLSDRNLHPEVLRLTQEDFERGSHFHAVHEGCKGFVEYVRMKSKLTADGIDLMNLAFSPKGGPLRLNDLATETDRNEQQGLMQMASGLVAGIRNPTSHRTKDNWPLTQEDALGILSFLSYLYRQVDKTKYVAPK